MRWEVLAAPLWLLEEEGERGMFGFSPAQTPEGAKVLLVLLEGDGREGSSPSPPFLIARDVSLNPLGVFLCLNLQINHVHFAALAVPLFCSCSPGADREGFTVGPLRGQRSPRACPCPGDIVRVTMGWAGTGQTLPSDFSQTLLELRHRQSCAPVPSPW